MHDLASLLPLGVASRSEVSLGSSPSSVARWTSDGDLVQLHPGVVVLADRLDEPLTRARAATLWSGGPLSHTSALSLWGLGPWSAGPLHVTVPADRSPRRTTGVRVHRTTLSVPTSKIDGVPVTHLGRSLVDAWGWAHSPGRNSNAAVDRPAVRRSVIEAVRDRGVSLAGLRTESATWRTHPGRLELDALLNLVAGGCQSELEIWGVLRVLPGPPTVPTYVQQHRVVLPGGRRLHLDAAWPELLVAVELDGAAFHGSREARERDLRRDSALAALGWVVLRFSYDRLVNDPMGCRGEIEAVVLQRLAAR